MSELNIFRCGIRATPKLLNSEAIITGVCIRFNRVQYELSYFVSGESKIVWMDESEFDTPETEKQKIGFR